MKRRNSIISVLVLLWAAGIAFAVPQHVSMDLSSLVGSDVQLEIDLYDNSGVIGDSWARIDNVILGSAKDDFEAGTLGAFDASLNPSSVNAVAGSLTDAGSYVMRIDEDPIVTPTITFRTYGGSSATVLSFDFEMTASGTPGSFGLDELVFSILDPVTLNPLLAGLTPGFGDVLAVNADGMRHAGAVTVAAIPAPGALLLGLIGSGVIGLWRRFGSPFNQS